MKETPLLCAMNGIVGGVKVQDQFLGRGFIGGDEMVEQNPMDGPNAFPVGAVFPAAQRRSPRKGRVALHRRLQCRIDAQAVMVVQILIAQTHRISVQSVYRYLAEYELEKKIEHDPRGGSKSKLSQLEAKELHDHLQETTYLHAKEICRHVKAKYGIEYTVAGMTFWLKTQNFIYKSRSKSLVS